MSRLPCRRPGPVGSGRVCGGFGRQFFECLAIPVPQRSSGFVRALQEIEQGRARRARSAHVIVQEDKFAKITIVPRCGGKDFCFRKAVGLRHRTGIKGRATDFSSSRPPACADYFVRISFARDGIRAGPLRSTASRKPRHAEVKAAPEEMHRAAFADEARAKLLKYRAEAQKDSPESLHVLCVVRGVEGVLIKADRVRYFYGHRPDMRVNAHGSERGHEFLVKIRHSARN